MHKDASNIFNLYREAVEEQPKMTTDKQGNKEWRLHGKLHRADAPAVEDADGTKEWWLHGKLHRDNGPAIERADGATAWYLHNVWYASAEAWAEASLLMQNKPNDAADVDAFLKQILKKQVQNAL